MKWLILILGPNH
jgi:hypothetical protein